MKHKIIYILSVCDGKLYRYRGVKVLHTFDSTGRVKKHLGYVNPEMRLYFKTAG